MHERSALGPADVSDDALTTMVATSLGTDPSVTRLLSSRVEVFPYPLEAITTAGRYWVSGDALVGGRVRPWRIFVKHIQAWSRSPLFRFVPPEHRALAEAAVPWRTEALAYRSDLRDRLPVGLQMPVALGVFDLDELSSCVWLEEVPLRSVAWDRGRYAAAAHLLGRLAGSPRVAGLSNVGGHDFTVRTYLRGRLDVQVLPLLRDDRVWQHPLVATAFDDDLRARVERAAMRAGDFVEELMTLPLTTSHGDACPNNLLVAEGVDGFVLIDYGFWGPQPVGFDLSQLLAGDVLMGRRTAEDLGEIEDAIVPAYVAGLRAEGYQVPDDVVRRAHALALLIFTGLSSLPLEHLDSEPTPDLHQVAAERAAIARFSLDLVDATA